MVLAAKGIFFIATSVFVGAAFEGFPYVRRFCRALWELVWEIMHTLWEIKELLLEWDEVPNDDPLHEE